MSDIFARALNVLFLLMLVVCAKDNLRWYHSLPEGEDRGRVAFSFTVMVYMILKVAGELIF